MADKKIQENPIREGTGDDINEQRGRDKSAYPKMDTEDKQHDNQPEYIDNEPNKTKEENES